MLDRSVTRLVVILDAGLKTKLVQLCERNDRTMSDQVRRLLKAAAAVELADGRQGEVTHADTETL